MGKQHRRGQKVVQKLNSYEAVREYLEENPVQPIKLTEHVQQEVFRSILMFDATRREILKLPEVSHVKMEMDGNLVTIRISDNDKEPKVKNFFVIVVEEIPSLTISRIPSEDDYNHALMIVFKYEEFQTEAKIRRNQT